MKVLSPQHPVLGVWPIERALPAVPPREVPAPPQPRAHPVELRNTVAFLFAILLISVISLLFMTQAANLATSGYQISQLQGQRDQLQRDNQALEVELAQLHSLPAIEKTATEKLHMTKNDLSHVQYVALDQHELDVAKQP